MWWSKNSVYEKPYNVKGIVNIQAHRKHLRIYVKIGKLEQGKLEIWRLSGL